MRLVAEKQPVGFVVPRCRRNFALGDKKGLLKPMKVSIAPSFFLKFLSFALYRTQFRIDRKLRGEVKSDERY
jgi:hypothetical protein